MTITIKDTSKPEHKIDRTSTSTNGFMAACERIGKTINSQDASKHFIPLLSYTKLLSFAFLLFLLFYVRKCIVIYGLILLC